MEKKHTSMLCYEYLNCNKTECPAYGLPETLCWLLDNTQCNDQVQNEWLEKIELCLECRVFEQNLNNENITWTLKLVAEQFANYKKNIESHRTTILESQKKLHEFKTTSIYLLKELDKKNRELLDERKNLENRIEEKTREMQGIHSELLQSTKMAAIGQFSAGIAHEINNPLGAIINYIRTLLANPDIEGQNRGYLELTMKGLFRIENIVHQILSFSGKQKSELKDTMIANVVNEALSFLQHKIGDKKINVKNNLNNARQQVHVDPFQLQQVFTNILNNAIDAVPKEGTIIIDAFSNNSYAVVKVTDNGKGIKKEYLDKVFDPFFSTKDVGKGTGLGLFISYNIIKIYQGLIEIESKYGKGTTVTVQLPVSDTRR